VILMARLELTAPPPMEALMTDPVTFRTLLWVPGVTLILVSVLIPVVASRPLRSTLGLRGAPIWVFPLIVVGTMGAGLFGGPFAALLMEAGLTFGALEQIDGFVKETPLYVVWPLAAVLPAVGEEIFFRGMFQRSLGNGRGAVLASGLAFGIFHLDPAHVVGVVPLGLYFAYIAAKTGSTLVPMVGHLTNNTMAIAAARYAEGFGGDGTIPEDPAEIAGMVGVAIGGGLVCLGTLALLNRFHRTSAEVGEAVS